MDNKCKNLEFVGPGRRLLLVVAVLVEPVPGVPVHHDHPCSVLHLRQGHRKQMGGLPGTPAGGVHGRVSQFEHTVYGLKILFMV